MSDFARGEWFIESYDSLLNISSKEYGSICDVDVTYIGNEFKIDPTWEELATAHLITAAPEMYSLLSNIDNLIKESKNEISLADSITSLCHNINETLRKARGEN